MESDERPNKVRKLSHDTSGVLEPPVDQVATSENGRPDFAVIPSVSNDATTPAKHDGGNTKNGESEEHEDSTTILEPVPNLTTAPTAPLSKNQLKKLRKQQEWEAGKDWRKAKRKEKAKEKKERKREQRAQEIEQQKAEGHPATRHRPQRPKLLPVTFVIDCGFDDKMMDKERISLGSQITRAYSDNSHAPFQVHLVVSSWGGLLKNRFDTVLDKHYTKWKGVYFTEDDFVTASERAKEAMGQPRGGRLEAIFEKYASNRGNITSSISNTKSDNPSTDRSLNKIPCCDNDAEQIETSSPASRVSGPDPPSIARDPPPPLPEPQTIYLTSDSPHTLTTLEPYSTYVIGGLVDKNRHKGICYRTAMDRGVKTAKLPIGEYMEMNSRFVLATNHVVEIMIRYLECGDWGEAFMKVVPKRKGGKLKETDTKDEDHSSDEDNSNDNNDRHHDYDDKDDAESDEDEDDQELPV